MSSKQLLLDLINSTNFPTVPLSENNVQLQNPRQAAGGVQYNTVVDVIAVPGQGYSGARQVYYRRLDLNVIAGAQFQAEDLAGDGQVLLNKINAQYAQADLGMDDLLAFSVPAVAPGQSAVLMLQSAAGSYRWMGQVGITIQGKLQECDAPAPRPTLTPAYWWSTLNESIYALNANPYGGVFSLTQHGISKLADDGQPVWRKKFHDNQQPPVWSGFGADEITNYQQNALVLLGAQPIDTNQPTASVLVAVDRSSGQALWSRRLAPSLTVYDQNINTVATDGTCTFVSMMDGTQDGLNVAVVIKLLGDGSIGWQRQFASTGQEFVQTQPYAMAIDAAENVYVAVIDYASWQVSLVKLDKTGTVQWQYRYLGLDGQLNVRLAVGGGQVYVAGKYSEGPGDKLLALDAATGDMLWDSQLVSKDSNSPVATSDLAADAQGNVVALTAHGLFRFDASGVLSWARELNAPLEYSPGLFSNSAGTPLQGLSLRDGSVYFSVNIASTTGVESVLLSIPNTTTGATGPYTTALGQELDIRPDTLTDVTGQPGVISSTVQQPGNLVVTMAAMSISDAGVITQDDTAAVWQAPQPLPNGFPQPSVAISDAVLVVEADVGGGPWDPQPISTDGVPRTDYFGQIAYVYDNSDGGQSSSASSSAPYRLPDDSGLPLGTLLHYEVYTNGQPADNLPSTVYGYLAPPRMTQFNSTWTLDPVVDADWIAAYNAALPFHIPLLNSDGQAEAVLYFDRRIEDNGGQYDIGYSYTIDTLQWPAAQMNKIVGVQTPLVLNDDSRWMFVYPLPLKTSTRMTNGGALVSQQLLPDEFGVFNAQYDDTPVAGQYTIVEATDETLSLAFNEVPVKMLPDANLGWVNVSLKFRVKVDPDLGPQLLVSFTNVSGTDHAGVLDDPAEYPQQKQKFVDWWNAHAPLRVEFRDIAGATIARRDFTGDYSEWQPNGAPTFDQIGCDATWTFENMHLVRSIVIIPHLLLV